MVCTEGAEMAAVSCGTSHVSAVSTPLRWIFEKHAIKSCSLSESAREWSIALYKSDQQLLHLWAHRENTAGTTEWVDGLLQVWPWVYSEIRGWTDEMDQSL